VCVGREGFFVLVCTDAHIVCMVRAYLCVYICVMCITYVCNVLSNDGVNNIHLYSSSRLLQYEDFISGIVRVRSKLLTKKDKRQKDTLACKRNIVTVYVIY